MKNTSLRRRTILVVFFALLINQLQAQTTLAMGDIAFTGYNCTPAANSDEFSFVILKSTGITSGTTIYFTDRNWKSGSCGTDNFCSTADNASYLETTSEFVWTAGSSLSYGTHVKITGAGTATTFTCSNGSASGNVLNLSNAGDQVFATQNGSGSTTTSNGPSGTMLAAIHANKATASGCSFSTTNWDDCTTNISVDICQSTANSNRPACLTTGTNCLVLLDGSSNEVDNGVYNCTSASSNTSAAAINAMRTAINNLNNWTTQNTTAVTLPPSGCNPLPVRWLYFNASRTLTGASLEWATASEYNCSHFEVERSIDLKEWKTLQHITGNGTKSNPTSYWYDDREIAGENMIFYYRIKQVDYDGKFEYASMRSIEPEARTGYTAFNFNSNPFSQTTLLKTFLPNAGQANIQILDANGNTVFNREYQYHGGYNRFNPYVEAADIMSKPGFYFLRASIEGETKTFKFLVQ